MHSPRKQARQARSRATQEAIVEAAARILETSGRKGLTTNAIADRAGVSIGSLYQYFPNKEAVLAAVLRSKRAELLGWMRDAAARCRDAPPEAALRELLAAGMRHQFERPRLAMEAEYAEQHLQLAPETAALAEEMAQIVLDTIRRFAPDAGPQEARDVVAIAKGMINAAAFAGEAGSAALVQRVERAIRGYLRETASNSAEIRAASSAAP
ncbi:TetR/AcrR family transcriptional regulator [Leisingera sp. McT4-56]|uniref:TetR/AcrR family transcriptional regulator n=1 Tax=Leisingera sp. McT4-56 TaxID=2881255 RepID=UPI001CF84A63|nr:TetR/AcrR family transcriptional regulator [Leisingera sp. McT4-56]MCB4456070.1 TetR/AcrR family transcriptional regulator [Leisingera sp. McT4-56]